MEKKQLHSHFVHHKSHTWTGLESNPLLRDEIPVNDRLELLNNTGLFTTSPKFTRKPLKLKPDLYCEDSGNILLP
jgi:hypothetical protein